MATFLCVLYDDPVDGYPPSYARDDVPEIERYHGGQTHADARGDRLHARRAARQRLRRARAARRSSRSAATGSSSPRTRTAPDSEFERELPDADVVISQPFWPAYLTAERIAKAPNLKLAITAGIGSDHVDLQAAIERGITVAEVTYSNSISVSEHVVMMILALVRNYIPSYKVVVDGGWNIADCVSRSYDLEGMQVGTVGAGRIGSAVLRRLKPFEVGLHYTDRHRLPARKRRSSASRSTTTPSRWCGLRRGDDQRAAASRDRAPVRRRADRADEARRVPRQHGARQDLRPRRGRPRARERASSPATRATSGSRSPRRSDHPWRTMPHHGMTPHTSGTSLSAQARYAAGTREILECWFDGRPIREEYLIVDGGKLAGAGAHSYSAGRRDRRLRGGRPLQLLTGW